MTDRVKYFLYKYASLILLMVILAVIICFLSVKTTHFFTVKNFINILEANGYKVILAVGMTFIIASGGIDLSIGSIISLSAILMAIGMKTEFNFVGGIIICVLAGALMGFFNGSLIHFTGINSLIITLATASIFRGISLILTEGTPITKFDPRFLFIGNGKIMNMQPSVSIAIVVVLISAVLMYKMKWGHYLKSLGANEIALKRTGIRTGFYKISSYIYMGVLAAIVGIILTARLNSAEPNAGLSMEIDAITAVIMGGTPISGGKASLVGTVIAVFLLGFIRNGLTIMSVSSSYQQFVTGTILLVSILIAKIKEDKVM